jgi:Cdc6-like AAA superfamily ATPase
VRLRVPLLVQRVGEWCVLQSSPGLVLMRVHVAGMPGTGKTATVREVVRQLHQDHLESTLPPFQYIEVNAMHLANPYQLYSVLWKQLSDHETTPSRALRVGAMCAGSAPRRLL